MLSGSSFMQRRLAERLPAPGPLRPMVGHFEKTADRLVAEAGAQALDQHRPLQGLAWIRIEQVLVQRAQGGQVVGDHVEGMHRGDQGDAFETCVGQFQQHGRIALGFEQADRDPRRRLVFVFEDQLERLHAAIACDEETAEVAQHALQRKQQRLHAVDAIVEFEPARIAGRRLVADQGFGHEATHAVEMGQGLRADTPGQFDTRQAKELAEAGQAHGCQTTRGFPLKSAIFNGNISQDIDQLCLRGQRDGVVRAGHHARAGRGRGGDQAIGQVPAIEIRAQAAFQRRPAAEQREAGADLDQQRARPGQAQFAAVTIGRIGQQGQQMLLGLGIPPPARQAGLQGARSRQRLAGMHPGRACGGIAQDDARTAQRTIDQGCGRLARAVRRAHGIERQFGKIQAGPAHGTVRRKSMYVS